MEKPIEYLNDQITLIHLNRKTAADLKKNIDFAGSDVLDNGLLYNILKSVKLQPPATKVVAYNTNLKRAIGFIDLEEADKSLFSIKGVFIEPRYRKMGLATRLLNNALFIAKEKGAKKINLNVESTKTQVIQLYKKLGFKEIGQTILGQGYLPQSTHLRIIRRVIVGQGFLTSLIYNKKDKLLTIPVAFARQRAKIFSIYEKSMDRRWIDFFSINAQNFDKGSKSNWEPPFFRNILINESGNSLAFTFDRPFSFKTIAELHSFSEGALPLFLEDFTRIMMNRGTAVIQIMLFNRNIDQGLKWFEQKSMRIYKFIAMGREL